MILDDREVPEPQTIFMVPVSNWSDGATAGGSLVGAPRPGTASNPVRRTAVGELRDRQ